MELASWEQASADDNVFGQNGAGTARLSWSDSVVLRSSFIHNWLPFFHIVCHLTLVYPQKLKTKV